MKISLTILAVFAVGVAVGWSGLVPDAVPKAEPALVALYVLVFLVGVGIGGSGKAAEVLRTINFRMVLVPLSVMAGTFLGVAALALAAPSIGLRDSLAAAAGFGYYSLSSVIIMNLDGERLAAVALLANIFREVVTLVTAPVLAARLFRLAPVSLGGATTMDTTLPIVTRFAGKEYAMICVFSGIVLTLSVPLLVPLILSFGGVR